MPSSVALKKKIKEIVANEAGEPDLYAYVRDLLTRSTFDIGLDAKQVVIDSKFDGSRRRPDLVVYRSVDGKPLRGGDYAHAVFEVKTDEQIETNCRSVLREKRSYVQSGTRWFFLIDQRVVVRIDVADREAFNSALALRQLQDAEIVETWRWTELEDPEVFSSCFGVLSAAELRLESELHNFRLNKTPFAYLDASGDGRRQFAATVREASELLRESVLEIIELRGISDLQKATAALQPMQADYGAARFDWANPQRPIDFEKFLSVRERALLSDELLIEYEPRREVLMMELEPFLYALRLEHDLLQQYAARQGIANASLLKVEKDKDKPNNRLLQSLAYETGSLILSRMLTIRFCEDYGLFRTRYISNGGIEVFWKFADHFGLPMQELLRQSYRHARDIFHSIFDANLLDWAIRRDDPVLSKALERSAYILSRWNFATVRGDILSGVYDQYLDVSQRRRLGEVYTRPEIARFMLKAGGWHAAQSILDPACGTGTFLVEALVQRLDHLEKAGAITAENVRQVIAKLHGLDISTFSIALAQIQVFWHLIDVVRDKTIEETREFARAVLPAVPLYGGWSSLDPMGFTFAEGHGAGEAAQIGMTFRLAHEQSGRSHTLIPPGFERTLKSDYDLVVMNPPYIRAERNSSTNYGSTYSEVSYKNTDTSVYFIYRALRQWVKPGGKLVFIVPIGISEAAYATLLRRVFEKFRITLIADLEGLGKSTFRGIKRPTIIMVIERSEPSPDDEVEMLQLDTSAMVNDVIDFGLARKTTVRRDKLDRLAYVPRSLKGVLAEIPRTGNSSNETFTNEDSEHVPAANASLSLTGDVVQAEVDQDLPLWMQALRANDDGSDALLTKFSSGDDEALMAMRELPRLGEIVRVVWVKRDRGRVIDVQHDRPSTERYSYRPELLFNYGVKLGGQSALGAPVAADTLALFKGQNIFPQGLLGEPLGRWSLTARRETTRYIYTYSDYLSYENTFALREISQLPTAAPIAQGQGFQNTAYVVELTEAFPLNSFLMSRIVQFYAARVLRSSIIEDLGCHWYKRTIPLLPIPPNRTAELMAELREAGEAVLDADSDLANRYREIDALITAGKSAARSVNDLIISGSPLALNIDLNGVSEDPVLLDHVEEDHETIRASDLDFQIVIPHVDLRTFVSFQLARQIEANPDAELRRVDVLEISVPGNLEAVSNAIRALTTGDLQEKYNEVQQQLDRVVAQQFGLSDAQRDHIIKSMTTDPILSRMRPMTAQRGLRVQAYADHSEGDRYE